MGLWNKAAGLGGAIGKKGGRRAAIVAGAIAAVAGSVLAAGAAAANARLRDMHRVRTAGGTALVKTVRTPADGLVRVLQQGGVYQSATYLDERRFEPVFAYYRAFDAAFEAEPEFSRVAGHGIRTVLMLGGGGFSYPKHLLTSKSDIQMDTVEIDPAVVDLARRWFFLDELERLLASDDTSNGNSLRVVEAEGRAFLQAPSAPDAPSCYDVIVNDAFSGADPVRSLTTLEAARAVKARLGMGGMYLVNVVSHAAGADLTFLRDEVATLLQAFAHVHVVPCSDDVFGGEDNYLLIATDGSYEFAEAVPFDADFLGEVLVDGGK